MRNKILHTPWWIVLLLVGLSLILVACGGEEESAPEPTVPPASPTPFPTAIFKQPTTIITPRVQNTPTAASPPTPDLARGERIYNARGCAECHGAQGEGVPDKGNALAGTTLSFEEFSDILRTGGRGELGQEHIFGTQRISPAGMEALYAYVKSLPAP